MIADRHAARARAAIATLSESRLEPLDLLEEAARSVGRVVPFDVASVMTTDPGTTMVTAHRSLGAPHLMFAPLLAIEVLAPDVNKFENFLSSPVPVVTLGSLDAAEAERSPRLQRVLRPFGLHDELRVVFRAGGSLWGVATLMRGADLSPFSLCERAFVAEVAADIGRALRGVVARHPEGESGLEDAGPGVLVVDESLTVLSTTEEAEHWRAQAADDLTPALAIASLYASTRRAGVASARVRLAEGGWLALRAARLHGETGRLAVTLQPAAYADLTALLMHVRRLSVAERQVADLHLRGFSEAAICTRLGISPNALRAHLLSVFTKVGVVGRVGEV